MANEDKATRYHRLQRRASLAGTALSALFLIILVATGASMALRDAITGVVANPYALAVVFVLVLAVAHEVIQLPLAFYAGVTLERRYGLATETVFHWAATELKAFAVGAVLLSAACGVITFLLRWTPEYWWLISALTFAAVLIVLAQLAPVLLLPLFYEINPVERPPLTDRLAALAERAGVRTMGVFEWRLSDRTRKANAALTGIGSTRCILVSDTLLADHSDDEVEVILAHELGHHVHRDIWSTIVLETMLLVLGFYVADELLGALIDPLGMDGKADVAALPLLALGTAGVSLLLMPLGHGLSRAHERRADRFALEMTNNPDAFVTAMRRLGARNLADEHPSRLAELLFHSHPPLGARIAAAREWAALRGLEAPRPQAGLTGDPTPGRGWRS